MGFMMSADRLLAFAAVSFLLIVIPGPSVLFVIGRALAQGRRAAVTTVVGNTLGAYVLVVAVAFGVGSVVERSVVVFTALKLAGSAYLVYLGVKAWRKRGSLQAAITGVGGARGGLRTLWEGFAVGVTNPKIIVFFAAVLQYRPPSATARGPGHGSDVVRQGAIFSAGACPDVCTSNIAPPGCFRIRGAGYLRRIPRRADALFERLRPRNRLSTSS